MPLNESMELQLTLIQADQGKRPQKISTTIETARKVMSFNVLSGFIGVRFGELSSEDQENLFQFIHAAQLTEIRNIKHL